MNEPFSIASGTALGVLVCDDGVAHDVVLGSVVDLGAGVSSRGAWVSGGAPLVVCRIEAGARAVLHGKRRAGAFVARVGQPFSTYDGDRKRTWTFEAARTIPVQTLVPEPCSFCHGALGAQAVLLPRSSDALPQGRPICAACGDAFTREAT